MESLPDFKRKKKERIPAQHKKRKKHAVGRLQSEKRPYLRRQGRKTSSQKKETRTSVSKRGTETRKKKKPYGGKKRQPTTVEGKKGNLSSSKKKAKKRTVKKKQPTPRQPLNGTGRQCPPRVRKPTTHAGKAKRNKGGTPTGLGDKKGKRVPP